MTFQMKFQMIGPKFPELGQNVAACRRISRKSANIFIILKLHGVKMTQHDVLYPNRFKQSRNVQMHSTRFVFHVQNREYITESVPAHEDGRENMDNTASIRNR